MFGSWRCGSERHGHLELVEHRAQLGRQFVGRHSPRRGGAAISIKPNGDGQTAAVAVLRNLVVVVIPLEFPLNPQSKFEGADSSRNHE
jgi:hypothetical protein